MDNKLYNEARKKESTNLREKKPPEKKKNHR